MTLAAPQIRIVILNYNGADLLPQCLPSISVAADRSRYSVHVTVLDNLSTDGGLDYVSKHFPRVDIVKAPSNRILCSYNDYLPRMTEEIAILLNNDIRVAPDFIDPLVERFLSDTDCFLTAPKVMDFEGLKAEAGSSRAGVKFGLFWCEARFPGYEKELEAPSETFSSGFGAFSREKFLALGGYDERYYPGIMEDVDLSWRAKQKGYHLYYEPRSIVYHIGQASFKKKYGAAGISVMAHRNNFIFMWKNFKGPGFWIAHIFFLPFRLIYSLLRGRVDLVQGFFQALWRSRA